MKFMLLETQKSVEEIPGILQSSRQPLQHVLAKEGRGLRKAIDRLATGIVTSSGLIVIASIVGLFVLFVLVIAPLWRDAKVMLDFQAPAQRLGIAPEARVLAMGCDEYQRIGYLLATDGAVQFYEMPAMKPLQRFVMPLHQAAKLTCAWSSEDGETFAAGTENGALI